MDRPQRLLAAIFLSPIFLVFFCAIFLQECLELLDQHEIEIVRDAAVVSLALRTLQFLGKTREDMLGFYHYFEFYLVRQVTSLEWIRQCVQYLSRSLSRYFPKVVIESLNGNIFDSLLRDILQGQNRRAYDPLKDDANQIRVLSIHPGRGAQALECTLRAVDVNYALFDAMSYTWLHNKCFRRQVLINGHWFSVNQNVYTALWSLRSVTEVRTTWIDQICINQADSMEKSDQVQNKMAKVYKNAGRVVIWLGPDSDAIADLFNAMKVRSRLDEGAIDYKYTETQLGTLRTLLSHKWWSRIWIVQEIALAHQSTAIVKCGTSEVSWRLFSHEIEHLMSNGQLYLLYSTDVILHTARHTSQPSLGMNHLDLILRLYDMESTDPRDKIFALTGLCGHDTQLIDVNYSLHSAQVFANFAVSVIKQTGNLRILAGAEVRQVKECS